jgi:hypothetical protein
MDGMRLRRMWIIIILKNITPKKFGGAFRV